MFKGFWWKLQLFLMLPTNNLVNTWKCVFQVTCTLKESDVERYQAQSAHFVAVLVKFWYYTCIRSRYTILALTFTCNKVKTCQSTVNETGWSKEIRRRLNPFAATYVTLHILKSFCNSASCVLSRKIWMFHFMWLAEKTDAQEMDNGCKSVNITEIT